MLAPYRVIDLSNERGLLCGQILADLGADVIQVEPPGGSSARRIGPWYKNERGPERSLFWWSYARNKRGIVLDLESEAGRSELLELVAGADFLIESETPGRMASLGLGYDDLQARNPGLVYVSITPFGGTGPRAGWADSDLVVMSASGHTYLSGDAERPPVRICVPQAHAHAGADAAIGALIAHFERQRSGRGQHVDISMQQSATLATMFRSLDAPLEQTPAERVCGGAQVGPAFLVTRYPLRDGWVVLGPAFLPSTGHFMLRLLRWIEACGYGSADTRARLMAENWNTFGRRLLNGELAGDAWDETDALLRGFFATRTKAEAMAAAVERKLLLAPILEIDEIVDGPQLAARGFAVPIEHREPAETVRYPGPFARFGAAPIRYRHAPPTLDQHAGEIRGEPARQPASTGKAAASTESSPLEGVKVLDFFWVLAGPTATRMLADYGATVIRVESMRRLDTLRVIPPYQFSHPHPEGAGGFQSANANKLGVTLDLTQAAGLEIARELVGWADVVTESFAPGVMAQAGLGWEDCKRINPEIIMISSCLMGQTGPWRDFSGFGNLAAGVTAFPGLASWPGQPPSGPFGAYTDFIGARANALSILAALEYRNRTGRGQYIDQSQAEAAFQFIAPAFLNYSVNGHVQGACGNADSELHPHGVFPAAGDDCWIALSVGTPDQWRGLCETIGRTDWIAEPPAHDVIDESIAAWACQSGAQALAETLQGRGVPAYAVLHTPDLFEDPQLRARDHFIETAHEIYQTTTIESSRLRLSRSPARRPASALHFGRDNRLVLESILGYTPERIGKLAERGVLM